MSKYCAVQLRVPVCVTVLSNSTAASAMTPVVGAKLTRAFSQRLRAKARKTLASHSVGHTEVFSLDLISDVCEFGSRNKSFVITRFTQLRVSGVLQWNQRYNKLLSVAI